MTAHSPGAASVVFFALLVAAFYAGFTVDRYHRVRAEFELATRPQALACLQWQR